jgi:glycerol-3-phosphate responsive antiterminator
MIEVLPAYGLDLVPMIARETGADILLGGLIPSKAFIRTCLDKGAKAVTTSNRDFWP